MLLARLWHWVAAWFARPLGHRRASGGRRRSILPAGCRTPAKPAWVAREIVRLKALMPHAGCRRIADNFNRRHARHREIARRLTVGKSFVADTIRRHRYEIEILRRHIKHRVPPALPRNLLWAIDLTGKADAAGMTPQRKDDGNPMKRR